eukprot:125469-Amphidinium_carterae.1
MFAWLRSERPLCSMEFIPGACGESMYHLACQLVLDQLLQAWLPSKQFHMRAAYDFADICHVNCQELLAWRAGLKALMRRDKVTRAR